MTLNKIMAVIIALASAGLRASDTRAVKLQAQEVAAYQKLEATKAVNMGLVAGSKAGVHAVLEQLQTEPAGPARDARQLAAEQILKKINMLEQITAEQAVAKPDVVALFGQEVAQELVGGDDAMEA